MRIAILTPTFSQFSGIDRVVEQEANDFMEQGNDVTIFCFKAEMKTNAKVIEIGMPKNQTLERIYRLFFFVDLLKIKMIVDQLQYFDKVICHQYPMTILGKVAKEKYDIHYTYHDAGVATPELFNSFVEKTYMRMFRFFTNKTINNTDNVISISKYLSDVLYKETGLKSTVEYVKIDKNRFNKDVEKGIVREKYKLGDSPIYLHISRISPHKGIHLLIQAFNDVLKQMPNAKLLIVGKETFGAYTKQLKKLAEKVNKDAIIFTGFVPDEELQYYYADCNCYCSASQWEGFNMPLVEAQECGKKVIAFNLCAHPEVVKNGILVEFNNIKKFSEVMIKILK